MYRLVLGCLLALALMDIAAACPPAKSRVAIVDGKQVVEWFCPPGKVMAMHENIYRCFDTCTSCPNGFCHENKCHCFPGTIPAGPGVCGKICPNCANGWCSSPSKCECNPGLVFSNGQCVAPQTEHWPEYSQYKRPPYWPAQWDPNQPWPNRQPPPMMPGQGAPNPPPNEDDGFQKLEGRMDQSGLGFRPQYFR